MKKKYEDIIILNISTKNYDQMMYGSWDKVNDRWTEKVTYKGGYSQPKNEKAIN